LHFILGQLKQAKGDNGARQHYNQVVRLNAPFEISFNAKINKATSGGASENEIITELRKMLKEQKYIDYKDQIYYAMANVELSRPDKDQAKYYLTRSAFTSINNNRQKGMSYEKLGDLAFSTRNYVHAQKYFDSSANVIPDDYPNAEKIRAKAEQLSSLVRNIDIVTLEDSLQRIANMGDSEREAFLENVIAELKEKERLKKEKEAQRAEELRKLQQSLAAKDASSSTFYFSNVKAIGEGFEEFRQLWGIRENEDNWRRSTKDLSFDFDEDDYEDGENDTIQKPIDPSKVPVDELTPEILMMNLPLTDSTMTASNQRLLEALYRSGMIYKEQLDEPSMGEKQFLRVINHGIENEHNVLSAFQLYQLNIKNNPTAAETHKQYIMNNYPNTDYANYLRDPDYFVKKKELDALAQKDYLKSVERFERGLYFPVIMKSETVIENEPDNKYRPQYFILKAMAMGQLNSDKTTLIPILEQAIVEYPDTPTASRANELLGYIINGVPAYEPIDFSSGANIYEYGSKDKMFVIIELNANDDSRQSLTKISDFTREYYGRDRLKPSTQMLNNKTTLIKIAEFKDEYHAQDYLRDFKKTKKHLGDLKNRKILFISPENFKTLIKEGKLADYEKFFNDNY
jgi:tetratricopeptide (TPR) repeat protein